MRLFYLSSRASVPTHYFEGKIFSFFMFNSHSALSRLSAPAGEGNPANPGITVMAAQPFGNPALKKTPLIYEINHF